MHQERMVQQRIERISVVVIFRKLMIVPLLLSVNLKNETPMLVWVPIGLCL